MKILMVASEAVPFAKTGGLGDVTGALSKELASLGHEVVLALPYYREVAAAGGEPAPAGVELSVPVGDAVKAGRVRETRVPGTSVRVWLLDCPEYYDRDGLYVDESGDYPDNAARFVFLSRGVLEAAGALEFTPDVIHCHDWQTALVPAYRETLYRDDPHIGAAATLLTIHSLEYQGLFWHREMATTNLDPALFNYRQLEFYGKLNFLKGGIAFADLINTVSRRHAEEIQTEEYGCGLEGLLRERADVLRGVPNGVDYSEWDPARDRSIPAPYSAEDGSGKRECKAALQAELGLPVADVPIIGMVTRLVDQKGPDLVASGLASILSLGAQFVLLGTGLPKYERILTDVAARYPQQASVRIDFNNPLAHRIQAGCDMSLMPSRVEPCGLSQLYSLKYGTVPIVRETGGLADTVTDYSPEALDRGEATGFVFAEYSREAMVAAVRRAVALFGDSDRWRRLQRNGMAQDWSWSASAGTYVDFYREAVRKRRVAP